MAPLPRRHITRTTEPCLLAFGRPDRHSGWAPVAVAAPLGYPPCYHLRCSARPEDWDACLPLISFLHDHRKDFLRGEWTNVLRDASIRLVEEGNPQGLTQLAIYAEPLGVSIDRLFEHHVVHGQVQPFGYSPGSPAPDLWGREA